MKICFPINQARGLESEIFPNFRATPALLLIDTETRQYQEIGVSSSACRTPLPQIDAIICAGGIGRGQFNGLRQQGIRVYNSQALTVMEALQSLASNHLQEVTAVECCGGHNHTHAINEHDKGGCVCGNTAQSNGRDKNGCGCGNH